MSSNGLYIGIPNGIVLCIDKVTGLGLFQGRIYHRYQENAEQVSSFEELLRAMRELFDEIQFPGRVSGTEVSLRRITRRANSPEGKEIVMSDKQMLAKHGDIATYIIRVQQRQNSTWQGRITWVDEDKTVRFRSILELIRLIEEGIKSSEPELTGEDQPSWD